MIRSTSEINWDAWRAKDRATLVFVERGADVLLIRKLRGLGAELVNAPGGKTDPGESDFECAIREVQEEVGITPMDLSRRGQISFQFVDGYSIFTSVFLASRFTGTARASAEAVPFWVAKTDVPYEEMWPDDRIWLPRLFEGDAFVGRVILDKEELVDARFEFF